MENYSIYLSTETEKYDFISICRNAGAKITDVAGCGPGYHICISATPIQAERINTVWNGGAV